MLKANKLSSLSSLLKMVKFKSLLIRKPDMNSSQISTVIHIIQASLSPVSIWATATKGLMEGTTILSMIGLLELIDIIIKKKYK